MCSKIKPAITFVSAKAKKTSQPQEEQCPHFVLRRTNAVPRKKTEIFTLVSSLRMVRVVLGGFLKETFVSLCFLPGCETCCDDTISSEVLTECFAAAKTSESQQ